MEKFKNYFKKGFGIGSGIAAGLLATSIMAVTVTGVINSFNAGDSLDAAKINENFTSLRTAIESIPNWIKSGNDAVFNGGNVGIGTTPTEALDVNGNVKISGTIVQDGWTEVTSLPVNFQTYYSNSGVSFGVPGYRIDKNGYVHFKGGIRLNTSLSSSVILFTLPTKYWPKTYIYFTPNKFPDTTSCMGDISPSGVFTLYGTCNSQGIFLNEITYSVD